MDLTSLQKKYPQFIYKNSAWELTGGDLILSFHYYVSRDIEFKPSVLIKGISDSQVKRIGEDNLSNLVFQLGLAEIPSYWKAMCSPTIVVEAGYLDKKQIIFWRGLISNMGQFFYENNLPFIEPVFEVLAPKPKKQTVIQKKFSGGYLVPLGGGKDSLVTLELLRAAKKGILTFTVNANPDLNRVVAVSGAKNIFVERKIDRRLIELNVQGFLNGHTPFSSILAVLGVGLAALFGLRHVAISQERSSNEGNAKYLGKDINHQYSKTSEFENKFRDYARKYLAKDIIYFSFLRPLYEIQISKVFSRYPKYFASFLSCNKPFTIVGRQRGLSGWCGECAKCLSVFSMLYPFIGKENAVMIFGKNLFENEKLLPAIRELSGQMGCKPMECVGTFDEMRTALYLSLQNTTSDKPYLLEYFQKNILPKYPNIAKDSAKLMASWDKRNNVPISLQKILKQAVAESGGVHNLV